MFKYFIAFLLFIFSFVLILANVNKKQDESDHDSNLDKVQHTLRKREIYENQRLDDVSLSYGDNADEGGFDESIILQNLPDCSTHVNKRSPILLVSTIDSRITGIDYATGQVVWSHETGTNGSPLVSSSMSTVEVTSDGKVVRLIPSLEGRIFKFDGESVEALPFTADSLLQTSFNFNDEIMFTGGKFSEILGLVPNSGDVKYFCDSNGCPKRESVGDTNQVLVVRKVSRTVRAIDPRTGGESWNFSVGYHDLNIAMSSCDSLTEETDASALPSVHFVLPKGLVIAVDSDHNVLWRQKLQTPIVSAWSLINGDLDPINLFSETFVPALIFKEDSYSDSKSGKSQKRRDAALYVGIHRKQLYIQQNVNILHHDNKPNIHLTYLTPSSDSKDIGKHRVPWKPYVAAAFSRTPLSEVDSETSLLDDESDSSKELAIRHDFKFLTSEHGFYLFEDEENLYPNISFGGEFVEEDISFPEHIYYMCFKLGPQFWWTVAAILIAYSIGHLFLFRYVIRFTLENVERDVQDRFINSLLIVLNSIMREHPQIVTILQRIGLNVPPLPPPPPPPAPAISRLTSEESLGRNSEIEEKFVSRYVSDFEPVQCLGKGGFGVVFQVRNKLDQNEYAVKRIVLPSKEASAERVKREVRALAKLSHPSIVRYYNSWLETPPPGWEFDADSWWRSNDTLSPSFSNFEEALSGPTFSPASSASEMNDKKRQIDSSLSGVVNKLAPAQFNVGLGQDSSHSCSFSNPIFPCISTYENNNNNTSNFFAVGNANDSAVSLENFSASVNQYGVSESQLFNNIDNPLVTKPLEDSFDVVFQSEEEHSEMDGKMLSCNEKSAFVEVETEGSLLRREIGYREEVNLKSRSRSTDLSLCFSSAMSSEKVVNPEAAAKSRKRRTKSERLENLKSLDCSPVNRPVCLDLIRNDVQRKERRVKSKSSKAISVPKTFLYIQMELCHKESLKEWLLSNHVRDTDLLFNLFNDIVHAVEFVHDRCLMHRDLKPSNIFFSLDGEVKIGDFGLVTSIEDECESHTPLVDSHTLNLHKKGSPIDPLGQRTVHAGTHLYMSPEQIAGRSYTYKVDIFSLGLILFELLVPFSTEMERRDVMVQARQKCFPKGFSDTFPDVRSLLDLALHTDPNERPTTRGIRARPPFASFQKDLKDIVPEEHFRLCRTRGHARSHSGSFSGFHSSTSSSSL